MKEHGIDVDVIEGSKTKDLLILEDELKAVAGNLYITTDDGSYERKGMVCLLYTSSLQEGKERIGWKGRESRLMV